MTPETVVDLIRQALLMSLWLSGPLLVLAFAAGVAISLVQIVTSMQDSAFSTIPRLAAFLAGILLSLPWMLMKLTAYTTALFGDLGRWAR